MKTVFYIALGIHIISILGILGLLLSQVRKKPRKLNPAVIHAGLTAFIAGIVMTSIWKQVNPDEAINHTKFGIKAVILTIILFLAYTNVKKAVLKNWVYAAMLGLTVTNVIIAIAI